MLRKQMTRCGSTNCHYPKCSCMGVPVRALKVKHRRQLMKSVYFVKKAQAVPVHFIPYQATRAAALLYLVASTPAEIFRHDKPEVDKRRLAKWVRREGLKQPGITLEIVRG